ncbi:Uncharacterised protein [Vibrio cholerae]|nr:Uncharacterised protein [Vibrio cholerae]
MTMLRWLGAVCHSKPNHCHLSRFRLLLARVLK